MLKLKRKAYRGIIIMFVTACFFVRHLCLEVLNGGETMKFFNKNINKVLSVVLVVVSVLVVLQFVCSNGTLNAGETPTESAMARVNPNIRRLFRQQLFPQQPYPLKQQRQSLKQPRQQLSLRQKQQRQQKRQLSP